MINLVLFGPPGSGKGTQSEKLIKKYGLVHISTGNILRNEISTGTPLGKKAQAYMDKGELVPDEDVIAMLLHHLDQHNHASGFIFDGFPRTFDQARTLRNALTDRTLRIDLMIMLNVPKEELINRLVKRGAELGRADDKRDVIENRIIVYKRQSQPVIDFYEKMHKFASIDGTGSIDEIFARICATIESLN